MRISVQTFVTGEEREPMAEFIAGIARALEERDIAGVWMAEDVVTFGRYDLAAVALCYVATLGLLGWVGWQRGMGMAFYGGLAVAAVIALYHMKLIRLREPKQCFRAFLHNTWFGAAVCGGIGLHFLLRSL